MRQKTINIYKNYKHFIIYTIIGFWCEIIDFALFYFLDHICGVYVLYAHLTSVNVGLICSFLTNTKVNFRTPDRMFRRAVSFFTIAWTGLAMSTIMMWFMVEYIEMNDMISKLITIVLAGIFQYLMNKRFTYRSATQKNIMIDKE
ncbi:MAG: GtrA family protein [Flavobacteriales bacterium]|nr:GtrA family protein [Flavobacteriales bacterium]MBQ8650483.1 GtrA family protein [Flavobacteriales bacterium]